MPNQNIRSRDKYINKSRSELLNHYDAQKKPSRSIREYLFNKIKFVTTYLFYRFGSKAAFQNYTPAGNKGVFRMSNDLVKISIAGDWAGDTQESRDIAQLMRAHHPHYTIHLGDTYFVGNTEEMESNFNPQNNNWAYGSKGSFNLMGNHDMYDNGHPFFKALSYFGTAEHTQEASYFSLENDYWRIIGLDTGYHSIGIILLEYFTQRCQLHKDQIKWIREVLKLDEDKRALIFMSHHQYNSAFDKDYPKAAEQLAEIIGKDRKVLWIWGHEHRCAIYGLFHSDKGIKAYGRCLGNGCQPEKPLKNEEWNSKKISESNIVAIDNKSNITLQSNEKEIPIVQNGFANLILNEQNLIIEYRNERDQICIKETWKSGNDGNVEGINIEFPLGFVMSDKSDLNQVILFQDQFKAIQ